jgi:hypothetical protein
VREVGEHRVVEGEDTLVHEEADGSGRQRLRDGVEQVSPLSGIRMPPPLRHDVSVTREHEAVELDPPVLQRIEEGDDPLRVDVLCSGSASGKDHGEDATRRG